MWNVIKNIFKRRKVTIDSLVKGCKGNLASLSFDIGKAVLYRKDTETMGDFSKPQEVLDRGFGDCDDYAYLWMKCLDQLKIKNHIYCAYSKQGNHAIVVFNRPEDEGYSYTSNDEFYKTNISDLDSLLKFAYPAERYEIVV
jgi:hypothetical protein